VITPRRTRLVRVPNLQAFRAALVLLSGSGRVDVPSLRAELVVVPTRSAARQLRRTLEDRLLLDARLSTAAIALPDLVTRDQLYDALRRRLPDPPRWLTAFERDVILREATRDATAQGTAAPFALRPGLLVEVARFYDQLKRQSRTVSRFEELVGDMLSRDAEFDRGAEKMLQQTRFLAATFRAYESRVALTGSCDEHGLRSRLLEQAAHDPVRRIIVTVADVNAEPEGLFPADFELLSRLPGLEELEIVATEATIESGFHQRIHEWLPGIEEVHARDLGEIPDSRQPQLAVPSAGTLACPYFVSRDREEELLAVARRIKAERRGRAAARPLDRIGIVFSQPLPYLYLISTVFDDLGVPYQCADALPLAAEPFAAALDLVFALACSDFTRESIVELLRSPHFVFGGPGGSGEFGRASVAALNRALSDARYLGGLETLRRLHDAWSERQTADGSPARGRAMPALATAVHLAGEIEPLLSRAAASSQIARLLEFVRAHVRPVLGSDDRSSRERRGRVAILDLLERLAAAHAAYGDEPCDITGLRSQVRQWIEAETFVLQSGDSGVQLVDSRAARYGDFDEFTLVGVIDSDWPRRSQRNIFYPSSVLAMLGWPAEKDRRAVDESGFIELLHSPSERVFVSTFTLEEEMVVEPSVLLDGLEQSGLSSVALADAPAARMSSEDALALAPIDLTPLGLEARRWADLRVSRSPLAAPEFHGQAGEQARRPLSVSAIETYLGCPFEFFVRHVLRLEEEPDDEEVLDPRRQGRFVHDVFCRFFQAWHAAGHGSVNASNLASARIAFARTVEDCLAVLSGADAALERTRLLGSSVAAGLGDVVLRMEAERPVPVVTRLLEHSLDGEFTFESARGPRSFALRGRADRLDLLEDGTFRLIDYKLGRPPNRAYALQLPIYALCAEAQLNGSGGYLGRRWSLGEAAYIAFAGPKRVVPLFPSGADRRQVLADAQERLFAAVDAIWRGEFPASPADVTKCSHCRYAAVCRRDRR
jgi:RecB family exonuclease